MKSESERKYRITERPRSLNPSKAVAMVICPIIIARFSTECMHSMRGVECEFECTVKMRRKAGARQCIYLYYYYDLVVARTIVPIRAIFH